jgi:hypothetical protein
MIFTLMEREVCGVNKLQTSPPPLVVISIDSTRKAIIEIKEKASIGISDWLDTSRVNITLISQKCFTI